MNRIETEEWRPAPNVPHYEVSNTGRVRSLQRWITKNNGQPLWVPGGDIKPVLASGYLGFSGAREPGRRSRQFKIHRLVCEAFHGPRPSSRHEVRHLNDDKLDNHIENLAWGTVADNAQDRIRNGRNASSKKTHCPAGHPYDEANTYQRPGTTRRDCKTCRRNRNRIFMATKYKGSRLLQTYRWQKLQREYRIHCETRQLACHICGEPIDYTAPPVTPQAFEPDHLKPVATHPELVYELDNLAPAHCSCNRSRTR